jgi:hypothetical protein
MNKKQILHNLTFIFFGALFAVGLSYVVQAAGTYTAPSGTAPANNTDLPLNVGSMLQVKGGGLSVNAFSAYQNAEFDGSTYFNGPLFAPTSNGTIIFGGGDSTGEHNVGLAISGALNSTGILGSAPLANSTTSTVCADGNGVVILCGATAPPPPPPSGNKRFYSVSTSQKSNDPNANFVGNVVNGHIQYSIDLASGLPNVAILGLDNDYQNAQVNTIPGMHSTSFNTGDTTLLNVTEKGRYYFHITSQGQFGVAGKFGSDSNYIAVSFFLKINNNWLGLTSDQAVGEVERYPVAARNWADYGETGYQAYGTNFSYYPYSFNADTSYQLNPGDTVGVYAVVYGSSERNNTDYNRFYYFLGVGPGANVFDITEVPN